MVVRVLCEYSCTLSECSVSTTAAFAGNRTQSTVMRVNNPTHLNIYIYLRFSVIYSFCWYNTLDCVANKFNTTLCKFCCLTYCTCYQSEPSYSTTTLGVTLPPKMIANTIELTIEEKNSLISTLPHFVARVCFGTIS